MIALVIAQDEIAAVLVQTLETGLQALDGGLLFGVGGGGRHIRQIFESGFGTRALVRDFLAHHAGDAVEIAVQIEDRFASGQPARDAILYGIDSKKLMMNLPPDSKVKRDDWEGKEVGFGGIARRIERQYRRYRQRGEANSGMEEWLDKVMVERT